MDASRVPVNLFTGFLGVGKTTAVLDLLRKKPGNAPWAVIVNEYGMVSIDEALLEGGAPEGVSVRSVAGGCVCCTTAPLFPATLYMLLRDVHPQRLLVECSGLGHPARLIDTIRRNHTDRLELRATIGLVAPIDFGCEGIFENPVFRDQVEMSDVLVLNKADTASSDLIDSFRFWAEGLFPPKLLIAATSHGHLDPAWLDLTASDERKPLFPDAHSGEDPPVTEESALLGIPSPGRPIRYPTHDGKQSACGWVFGPGDLFDEGKLLELFGRNAGIRRMKGVFRVDGDWIAVQRVSTAIDSRSTAYRRDSRVEVIAEVPADGWEEFEQRLTDCLIRR